MQRACRPTPSFINAANGGPQPLFQLVSLPHPSLLVCSNCLSKEKWPLLARYSPLARINGFGLSQHFTNTAKYNAKAAACAVQTFTGTAQGRLWVEPMSWMPGNSSQTSFKNREVQEPNNAATLFLNVRCLKVHTARYNCCFNPPHF